MKKLALLVITTILVSSCSIETKGDPFFIVSEINPRGNDYSWYNFKVVNSEGKKIGSFSGEGKNVLFIGDTLYLKKQDNNEENKLHNEDFEVIRVKNGKDGYKYHYETRGNKYYEKISFSSNKKFPLKTILIFQKK